MSTLTVLSVNACTHENMATKRGLEAAGLRVLTAASGAEALEALARPRPDVVSVVTSGPDCAGLQFFRRLRERSEVPILIISRRFEEADVVLGLELGADGYLRQPYRLNELVARIRALARRPRLSMVHRHPQDLLICGPVRVSLKRHEVDVDGRGVELTPTEFRLLTYLMGRPGRTVSREMLLQAVGGYSGCDAALINTHIMRLRSKLETEPDRPTLLLTIRGRGYMLAEENGEIRKVA